MRKFFYIFAAAFLLTFTWYGIWLGLMATDVKRVQDSVDYHYHRIKSGSENVIFKVEKVKPTGFPFGFRVALSNAKLTQVWMGNTYGITADRIELKAVDSREGRYRVTLPDHFSALYTEEHKQPEQYSITLQSPPAILLRAQPSSRQCPNLPGMKQCDPVGDDDPLVSLAAQLPAHFMFDASLNGKTERISFDLTPVNIPVFITIPMEVARHLQLFVGMLREALVFKN
jgi:hypothetical protein